MNETLANLGDSIVTTLEGALGNVWYLVLVNFIGALGILIKVTETQCKRRSTIISLAILNYLCWITYFVLYGNLTAATVNSISCIQAVIFMQRQKYKWANSILWMFFFIALQIGAGVFTWRSAFSLFSICAGILSSIAYFVMDEKLYRYFFLALILLWIGNGIVYFYPIALIHDVFAATSIIIAIIRYNILGKDKKQKPVTEAQEAPADDQPVAEETINENIG